MITVDSKLITVDVVKIPVTVEEVKEFLLPLKLVKSTKFTAFLSDISSLLERNLPKDSPEVLKTLSKYAENSESEEERKAWIKLLIEFYSKLLKLKNRGLDTIWIPIIKSYIISTMFGKMFDYIVGNPPWIVYRLIANLEYQNIIKNFMVDLYNLVSDSHLVTQMEMATLFFTRTMDLYLKDNGMLGFVMPRSIFSAEQHSNFRTAKVSRVNYKITKIIDCENVEPLFFEPACAVIARKGEATTYPIDAIMVYGKLPEDSHKILPFEKARSFLKIRAGKLFLNSIGTKTWLDYSQLSLRIARGHYYDLFKNGATMYPYACWFIDVIDVQQRFVVAQSSKRVEIRGHVEYRISPLPIEKQFVYGAFTSAEIMPFCHLSPSLVVLPIIPLETSYKIIKRDDALRAGYGMIAKWLEEAEKIWSKVRGEKERKMTLYKRLDFQRGLTCQSPKARFKVVYTRSSTTLTACVIDVKKVVKENPLINGVIIGHTLYFYDTDNENEAYYLSAVLNSSIIDEFIKPMQTKGEYGERDIGKRPLEFPIPRYDPSDEVHKRLAELSKKASEIAQNILPQLLIARGYDKKLRERGVLTPQEVGTLRKDIRNHLRDIIQQIDDLVIELLKTSVSKNTGAGSLDKYFKKT